MKCLPEDADKIEATMAATQKALDRMNVCERCNQISEKRRRRCGSCGRLVCESCCVTSPRRIGAGRIPRWSKNATCLDCSERVR